MKPILWRVTLAIYSLRSESKGKNKEKRIIETKTLIYRDHTVEIFLTSDKRT
jgi:hypothetical protein